MAKQWEPNRREKLIAWVWEVMGAAHPEKWGSVMGPLWDKKRERERKRKPHLWPRLARTAGYWADIVNRYQDEAVTRAVRECETWPRLPSRLEFERLCRGERPTEALRHQPLPVLEESQEQKAARLARGSQHLAQLRSMVKSA